MKCRKRLKIREIVMGVIRSASLSKVHSPGVSLKRPKKKMIKTMISNNSLS